MKKNYEIDGWILDDLISSNGKKKNELDEPYVWQHVEINWVDELTNKSKEFTNLTWSLIRIRQMKPVDTISRDGVFF